MSNIVVEVDTEAGTVSALVLDVPRDVLIVHDTAEGILRIVEDDPGSPWEIRADRWDWEEGEHSLNCPETPNEEDA